MTIGIRPTTPRSRSAAVTSSGPALTAGSPICSSLWRIATSFISSNLARRRTAIASCYCGEPGVARWWLLNTAAPGAFRAQETGPNRFEPSEVYDGRIIGAWQETASGYSLEVRVPLNLIGEALGVGVIDVDRSGADYAVELTASWDEATGSAGRFIRQRPELQTLLSQFGRAGGRFRVLDQDGWVLAVTGRVAPGATGDDGVGLLGGLFRWLLEREDPPYPPERPAGRVADETLRQALLGRATTAWYGSGPEREAIVAAAVPIAGAARRRGRHRATSRPATRSSR